jgi:hypothetical protein
MTTSIAVKVQQKRRQKPESSARGRRSDSDPQAKPDPPDEKGCRVSRLPLPLEDVALGYFIATYAPTTQFDYLSGHWSTLAVDENVRIAMHAPALASLALVSRQPELMRLARGHYSKALALTNKALGDPQAAVLDSTLLSVLLLSAFEGLAFRGRDSPQSWIAHIQGSATLLSLRGEKQLDSELGQKLFHHASLNISTCCSQQLTPIPTEFSRLQERAAHILDPNSPKFRTGKLLDRMAALRVNMRGMKATEVVREALYLDREASNLLNSMKTLSFKVTTSAESAVEVYTYKGIIHQYNSQNAARYWNVMRMLRLVFNEWIFCAFQHELRSVVVDSPEPDDPLHEYWDQLRMMAMVNGNKMIDDILASVPYSLEFLEKPSRASARFLIWPLASIGASELCPVPAKEFVINRLRALGERHYLEQATEAAIMLEEGGSMEDW